MLSKPEAQTKQKGIKMKVIIAVFLMLGVTTAFASGRADDNQKQVSNVCPNAKTMKETATCLADKFGEGVEYTVETVEKGFKVVVWKKGASADDTDDNHRGFIQFFVDELIVEPVQWLLEHGKPVAPEAPTGGKR